MFRDHEPNHSPARIKNGGQSRQTESSSCVGQTGILPTFRRVPRRGREGVERGSRMEQTEGAGSIDRRKSFTTTNPTSLPRNPFLKNLRQNSDGIGLLCPPDGDSSLVLMEIRGGRSGHRGRGGSKRYEDIVRDHEPNRTNERTISQAKKKSESAPDIPERSISPVFHLSEVGGRSLRRGSVVYYCSNV